MLYQVYYNTYINLEKVVTVNIKYNRKLDQDFIVFKVQEGKKVKEYVSARGFKSHVDAKYEIKRIFENKVADMY